MLVLLVSLTHLIGTPDEAVHHEILSHYDSIEACVRARPEKFQQQIDLMVSERKFNRVALICEEEENK